MVVVEQVAFAVASAAVAALAAVLVVQAAAPEPQVGPEGRAPAWLEQERGLDPADAPTASRSAEAG